MSARRVGPVKERLGRYTLVERIASGGMAEIFRASTEGPDGAERTVAIKRILPERARNVEFMGMFLNEARIAATLHHPNVIEAYDFGSENGAYYLAMEYLRGRDTRRIVQGLARAGQKLPLEIAIAAAIGIATGLHYVHERLDKNGNPLGLVHRDVSPQNIFLTTSGGVKLVDFGVAKAVHRVSDTLSGTIKGKVTYMSPEQVRADRLDRRSDIFSLSIVLWELTVGRRLFEGVSEAMVMNAIEKLDAPRPSQMAPRYPADLERIVMKGLSRHRGPRYQTAEEMRVDLEAYAREQKLDISAKRVAAFVRSLPVEADDGAPTAAQIEWERALRRAQAPGARPSPTSMPTSTPSPVEPEPAVRSVKKIAWVAALGLLAGAGVGVAWYSAHERSSGGGPAAAAPTVSPAPAPAIPEPPKPPAVPPPPAIEEPTEELVPPAAPRPTKKHGHDRAPERW
jgi:serine/threonine protein kinase